MGIAIKKMFARLLFWLWEFLDALLQFFRILCGIENVGDDNIITTFLKAPAITKAFGGILLISIFVAAVCVIVAIVKSIIATKAGEARKSPVKIAAQGGGTIITSLVMAFVMVLGITTSGEVLKLVDQATRKDNLTISQNIFDLCVKETYPYKEKEVKVQKEDEYGMPVTETVTHPDGSTTEEPVMVTEKQWVMDTNAPMETGWRLGRKDENGNLILDEYGNQTRWEASDIKFAEMSVNQVFGVRKKTLGLFENEDRGYKRDPMVELDSFNFFLAYFATVILILAIAFAMLGLVKRLYDLVFLFLCLPLISATIPLDDGARFRAWRESVMSKVVLAFGAVLSVNIFMLMLPTILNMELGAQLGSDFFGIVAKIFLILGGALAVNGGQMLMARLMGTSAEEGREMAQAARALIGGTVAAAHGAGAIKRAAVGGTNRYGRHVTGALGIAGKIGAGATNLVGNAVGGDAYRRKMSGVYNKTFGSHNPLKIGSVDKNTGLMSAHQSGGGGLIQAAKTAQVAHERGWSREHAKSTVSRAMAVNRATKESKKSAEYRARARGSNDPKNKK